MNYFKWIKGRQKSGYDKMLFCSSSRIIKFDLYLLRFPQGSQILPHTDKVKEGKHYRLNIVLQNAKEGGVFQCDKPIINTKRIKLFRPDINEHSVSKVMSGNRYLISLGWIRNIPRKKT